MATNNDRIYGKRPVNSLSQQENERIIQETIRRLKHGLTDIIAGIVTDVVTGGGGGGGLAVLTDDASAIMLDDGGHIMYVG